MIGLNFCLAEYLVYVLTMFGLSTSVLYLVNYDIWLNNNYF